MESNRAKVIVKTNAEFVFNKIAVEKHDLYSYEGVKVSFISAGLVIGFDFLPIGSFDSDFLPLDFSKGEVKFSDRKLCQTVMPFLNRRTRDVEDYTECKLLVRLHAHIPGPGILRLYAFARRTELVQGEV